MFWIYLIVRNIKSRRFRSAGIAPLIGCLSLLIINKTDHLLTKCSQNYFFQLILFNSVDFVIDENLIKSTFPILI